MMSSRKTRDSWMHGWQSSKQRISGFVSHPYTDKNGKLTADGGRAMAFTRPRRISGAVREAYRVLRKRCGLRSTPDEMRREVIRIHEQSNGSDNKTGEEKAQDPLETGAALFV